MSQVPGLRLGCAGWALNREHQGDFAGQGTHLQRYARVLNAVEVNSSFYRAHQVKTWARWGEAVAGDFRFAVKVPQTITHVQRLRDCDALLDTFLSECTALGERLGCLLIQLPPSLAYQPVQAAVFFEALRQRYDGPVAIEPRHLSWVAAQGQLEHYRVAQVAADPARLGTDARPSGWPGLQYWRLHGSPEIYYSAYGPECLQALAAALQRSAAEGVETWCIFDNTAAGAALGNALALQRLLGTGEPTDQE
ncbi:DUF72 domain-containing protein [Pseudomonas syringae]